MNPVLTYGHFIPGQAGAGAAPRLLRAALRPRVSLHERLSSWSYGFGNVLGSSSGKPGRHPAEHTQRPVCAARGRLETGLPASCGLHDALLSRSFSSKTSGPEIAFSPSSCQAACRLFLLPLSVLFLFVFFGVFLFVLK